MRIDSSARTARYEADLITSRPLTMSRNANHAATVAERSVRELTNGPGAQALEGLARFLLRSEAIASSLIEGIAPSPQQVALAELAPPSRPVPASPQV